MSWAVDTNNQCWFVFQALFGPQLFVSFVLQQQQHCGDVWPSVTRAVSGGLFLEQQWQETLWGARSCSSLGSRWFWVLQKLCHYTSSLFVKFVFFWSLATMGLVLQSHIYEGGVLVAGVFLACHAIFIVVGVWKFVWWVDGSYADVSWTFVLEGSEVMSAMKGKKKCIFVNERRQGTNNLKLPTRNHPSSDPDCEVFR